MRSATSKQSPNPRLLFNGAFASACRPRKVLTVSQWADAHRRLTPEASSEPGPWRTARVPYLREIMDCLSMRSPVRKVTIMKSSQGGGTEVSLNWLGYIIDHAPGPTLVVVPTLEVRKRWVSQRLDPMLGGTPRLREKLDIRRRRDGANSEEMKLFPGGLVVIGGANSPASLASMPIRYVINDELDRFPWQAGNEGDPLGLIRERQKTFPRRKELNISSPTIAEASRIEQEYEASDQRQYHVPCPHCDQRQTLKWENLRWDRALTRAIYVCEYCGCEIEEYRKTWMLENGKWIAKYPERKERGYHWTGLYSPLGLGHTWLELAREFIAVHKDPVKFKRFINTVLAQTWEDRTNQIKTNELMERAEPYRLREIPPGCYLLTAGVDVQADRFEVQVLGFGPHDNTWIIDYLVLPLDPSRRESWRKLGEILAKPMRNHCGREMHIQSVGIDTGGHFTHESYAFVAGIYFEQDDARPRRLMAIKGANTPNKPVINKPSFQDINRSGRTIRRGVKLWLIGVDTVKALLFGRLRGDAEADAGERKLHFSADLTMEYYDGLLSETYDPERHRWVKRGNRRNEPLDTWVYAYAAACHPEIRMHRMRMIDWENMAAMLDIPIEHAFEDEALAPPRAQEQKGIAAKNVGFGSEDWNL